MAQRAAVPNLLKHQMMWLWHATEWMVTTIWSQHSSGIGQERVDADRAELRGWAANAWRNIASDAVRLQTLKAYDFTTSPPTKWPDDEVWPSTVIAGVLSDNENDLPPGAAIVFSLRTGPGAPSTVKLPHGRLYHPGTHSAFTAARGSVPNSGGLAVQGNYDDLRLRLDGVGDVGQLSVVSFYQGGPRTNPTPRLVPIVHTVTHIYVASSLGYIRTRRPNQAPYTFN